MKWWSSGRWRRAASSSDSFCPAQPFQSSRAASIAIPGSPFPAGKTRRRESGCFLAFFFSINETFHVIFGKMCLRLFALRKPEPVRRRSAVERRMEGQALPAATKSVTAHGPGRRPGGSVLPAGRSWGDCAGPLCAGPLPGGQSPALRIRAPRPAGPRSEIASSREAGAAGSWEPVRRECVSGRLSSHNRLRSWPLDQSWQRTRNWPDVFPLRIHGGPSGHRLAQRAS